MAKKFSLVSKDESIEVPFWSGGKFQLVDSPHLWPFLIGGDGRSRMTETFQIIGRGDIVTNLGLEKTNLERYIDQLRAWHENPIEDRSWWLYWNLDGEGEKRTLLYPGTNINHVPSLGVTPMGDRMSQMKLSFTAERHPAWENPTVSEASDTGVSVVGAAEANLLQVTNTGTLPSRIASITITNESAAGTYETMWLGFRPYYKGYSLFENGLDLADGTAGTDTSSSADTNAVSGSAMVCTFATADTLSESERVKLRMSDVVLSGSEGWKGRYFVLLRYRCSASDANEFGIQLRWGYDGGNFTQNNEQFVSTAETDYHILEMGEIEWPPSDARNIVSSDILTAAFKIYAERLSGSDSLHLDRLILIPSEHALKIEDAAVDFGGTDDAIVYTFENDVLLGYTRDSGTIEQPLSVDASNWYIPIGETNGAILGFCAVRSNNISNKADTADITVNYYPRWRSYRL